MEILGVGPSELIFIIIIALIVLGPKDMQKAGRTIGKWLRQIVTSDGWKLFQQTSREIQTLPNRLMREAALDEDLKDVQKDLNQALDPAKPNRPSESASIATPQSVQANPANPTPSPDSDNKIMPPASPDRSDEEKNA